MDFRQTFFWLHGTCKFNRQVNRHGYEDPIEMCAECYSIKDPSDKDISYDMKLGDVKGLIFRGKRKRLEACERCGWGRGSATWICLFGCPFTGGRV